MFGGNRCDDGRSSSEVCRRDEDLDEVDEDGNVVSPPLTGTFKEDGLLRLLIVRELRCLRGKVRQRGKRQNGRTIKCHTPQSERNRSDRVLCVTHWLDTVLAFVEIRVERI